LFHFGFILVSFWFHFGFNLVSILFQFGFIFVSFLFHFVSYCLFLLKSQLVLKGWKWMIQRKGMTAHGDDGDVCG